MIRRPLASILLTASTGALLVGTGPLAHAAEHTAHAPVTAGQAATEEGTDPAADPVHPVIAEYEGRKINLAESWEGANICTELPSGEVHCYATEQEASADPALPAQARAKSPRTSALRASDPHDNCAADYWCLYQDANYKGRRLQFSSDGKKNLGDYGFRDKLSSVFYWVGRWSINYGNATIWDSRSWPLDDRQRDLNPPKGWPNLQDLAYPGGGNWNDKVDVFEINRA